MLDKARATLGTLSVEELRTLRDEIDTLLTLYKAGGAVTGWGSLELKRIPKRQVIIEDNKPVLNLDETGAPIFDERTGKPFKYRTIYYGPYLYVRRWTVDANGVRRLRTVGYYGKAGVAALARGLGAELLEAHNQGGESAGEAFLVEQGVGELPERILIDAIPESVPRHPLARLRMDSHSLEVHPLFAYFAQHAPVAAKELLSALREYEVDAAMYQIAEEEGYTIRAENESLKRRRAFARLYKLAALPKFRIRRRS